MPRTKDDYVFFWKPNQANGWGSQWYPSPFDAVVTFPPSSESQPRLASSKETEEDVHFPTAEHWMMVQKALLFGDIAVARDIIAIKGSGVGDCRKVKAMGREVKNFKESVWVQNRERIVLEGTVHKFRSNRDLLELLLATGNQVIAEASSRDKIWGIGFGEKKALDQGEGKWGLNLLGKAMMETRNILRAEEKEEEENEKTD